ncbi:hypothetical protein TDB9533_04710 [Thalassocella blandensis]|nr:hypothetical protein TDB9533_04710 [Thalassocella blandensis]
MKVFAYLRSGIGSVRQWHWISSAVCLVGMLLFSVTGITLNHASAIPADLKVIEKESVLPEQLLVTLQQANKMQATERVPKPLRRWLQQEQHIHVRPTAKVEWASDELYVALPRPGGDAWFTVDLNSGDFFYENTTRGLISYLNDLHKGRDTGTAWRWFIDVFAGACIVFTITGLILLTRQTRHRPTTWPVVGLGFVVPLILIILFVH